MNKLSSSTRLASSFETFKSRLKPELFTAVYHAVRFYFRNISARFVRIRRTSLSTKVSVISNHYHVQFRCFVGLDSDGDGANGF